MALSTLANNPMNFTENQHGNVVLEKLKAQREEGRFCDVTLYVEGKQFQAHRNVLASCSPYFDSVLKMHRTVKEHLTVTCQNSEIFQCLLNYMYTGSVVIDKNNVTELLRLANHFLVSKLKSYCAEYLDRYLDISNCLSVKEMAEKYNMPSLLKAATLFVQVHLNKVIQQDEILSCSLPKIEAFLTDKAWTVPQNAILNLITRWINHDIRLREHHMKTLLTFVDWNALDGAIISAHIDCEPLYSSSELSLYFILQALVDNNLLFPKYQSIYQVLQTKFSQSTEPDIPRDPQVNGANEEKIEKCDTCLSIPKTKLRRRLILRRSHRRGKQKFFGSRPGTRLAALKAALVARRNKTLHSRLDPDNDEDSSENFPQDGLKCHLCSHVARGTSRLEQHLSLVHEKDVTYKCGICGFICQWNSDYHNHMKTHFPGPPFKCDSCDYGCDQLQSLLTHRMKHSDERPLCCDQCGYRCRTRPNLLVHLRCHSGDRPYKCETCGRAFTMKSTLEQHLASHSNDRPYLCDTCGFSTKYLSHLIAHKRIHSGDVYRCSYPQCKYSTPKKSQLGSHARTHAGVRPHSCNICGRGFLEKSHLVRHERIHLEEKPFKCTQCEYASSRRDKLKEHYGRHHGENASAKVPYKARPMRGNSSSSSSNGSRSAHKSCHENNAVPFNSTNNIPDRTVPNHQHQPLGTGELELMMPHHNNSAAPSTNNAPHPQPPAPSYPNFPDTQHSSIDFHSHHHHHQLLNRPTSKTEHHGMHHHQNPTHHHVLPPSVATSRSQHHQTSAAAVAAMMLDPRFHHPNPGGAYHPGPPPVSMVAQGGGNQGQPISGQHHHQGEYPCMPLF